ncbi:MAG: DNA/RNA non-specific endonuclease [Bacteroidales bacterium]|nr:DNA/RNA non-specific endonuclease [Bacteroidales bacterium]
MKKTIIQFFFLLVCHAVFSAPQISDPDQFVGTGTSAVGDTSHQSARNDFVISARNLFPAAIGSEILIHKTGYSVSYNCSFNIANWVAYELTKEETKSKVKRKNNFIADPFLDSCLVVPDDYIRSGYDKGHLAPSADMCWSLLTMKESFYMTNMAPQKPRFNRGMWKRLEDQARDWASENDSVFIVTGPVLKTGMPTIGRNRISVPDAFYKVIFDFSGPEVKGIAFVMDNKRLTGAVSEYAVSIDSVEQLTGLDLFYNLPDDTESFIESNINLKDWLWNGKAIKEDDEEDGEE